jgi:hypothetical protein
MIRSCLHFFQFHCQAAEAVELNRFLKAGHVSVDGTFHQVPGNNTEKKKLIQDGKTIQHA